MHHRPYRVAWNRTVKRKWHKELESSSFANTEQVHAMSGRQPNLQKEANLL